MPETDLEQLCQKHNPGGFLPIAVSDPLIHSINALQLNSYPHQLLGQKLYTLEGQQD